MSAAPLYLLHDIQAAVDDELVHMSCLFCKPRDSISALLRGPKLILEQRVVLCANDGKVIRHICGLMSSSICLEAGVDLGMFLEEGGAKRLIGWTFNVLALIILEASFNFMLELQSAFNTTTMFGAFRPTNSLCSGLLW